MSLFPNQDSFVRGEISPRLHARASLDLYKAGLSRCQNFITLPHGGLRKRGGTYFVGEVKDSSKATRLIPFIFNSEQAYALEFGDLYLRVYAYGTRVGTVEAVTPWLEAELDDLQFYQSADVMWIVHPDHTPQVLTRTAHTTWTLAQFIFEDGPYLPINITNTKLTPAETGAVHPKMTSLTTPSGTVAGGANVWKFFDLDKATGTNFSAAIGVASYDIAGAGTKVCDAYWIRSVSAGSVAGPASWDFDGFDGTNWITLDSRQAEPAWSRGETRFYEFNNETAYQSYRLNFTGSQSETDLNLAEVGFHEAGDTQTPFNLTASSIVGINGGTGFQTTDVGRSIRLRGSDNQWRWARIVSRLSTTVVTIRLYGHSMPDLNPIVNWAMGAFDPDTQVDSVTVFEERLSFGQQYSVYASRTADFEVFTLGEADDDALQFRLAGGGQANEILWLKDADGFLLTATAGGIRALSGSGYDEALTPSSFKNRKSRTFGCARIAPVDAGASFLYVTRSRKVIADLALNSTGKFVAEDIGQISEHIPKRGVVELAFQNDPDPIVWFPLDETGELGSCTYQPSQEVRGFHRQIFGGVLAGSANPVVERAIVTPGQDGNDDVWLIVRRTIGGATKRYIEIMSVPFEYGNIEDAFQVDCGLTYSGGAATTVTGATHLIGETVDVLAGARVYKGLLVDAVGHITLPAGSPAATPWQAGLPSNAEADTLELDVGARDGSLMGRRKRITKVIMSLFETDLSGLEIKSLIGSRWEKAKLPTVAVPTGVASLYTGNVEVPIDDSWAGQGRVSIRHTNPTPCTIRAMTPEFDFTP